MNKDFLTIFAIVHFTPLIFILILLSHTLSPVDLDLTCHVIHHLKIHNSVIFSIFIRFATVIIIPEYFYYTKAKQKPSSH
jgi:uncharacterized membrane protein